MQKIYACLAIVIATVIAQPQSALAKHKGKTGGKEYLLIRMNSVTVTSINNSSNSPRGTKPLPPTGLVNSPAASSSVGASRTNLTHR
jgi:hypothetical protein